MAEVFMTSLRLGLEGMNEKVTEVMSMDVTMEDVG
jgi:hypothetical protein